MESTFEGILRSREVRGEKGVALARLAFISIAFFFDLLVFSGRIAIYTADAPDLRTLLLDLMYLAFASTFAFFAARGIYRPFFKFITISLDYLFIVVMFLFDPSIAQSGRENIWLALIAPTYLFYLNLMRFSVSAARYAAVLSAALCTWLVTLLYGSFDLHQVLTLVIPLSMLLLIGLYINSSGRRMMEEANTKQMLERYLAPQLVQDLHKSRRSLEPGGRRQKVTMLFADIRGFSRIAESLSPERVVELLNDYLSTMTEVIFRNEGTIDKFIGDAIMTTFGTPDPRPDDAWRAVRTALEMRAALAEFNARHSLSAPLEIGIGLHTGDVIAGNIGSSRRLDYTVIGDNVNLCARIEGLTKYYGCVILASAPVMEAATMADAGIIVREIDTVVVKGRTQPVVIFEVLS
jgi:adenylate cyclase